MIPWVLLPAHARRSWFRSLLTVGSVAVALFLYGSLRTVVTSIEEAVRQSSSSRLVVQSAISLFAHLPISMYRKVDAVPGVRAATHWTWFGGVYLNPSNFFARFAVDVPSLREVYGDRGPGDMVMPAEQWEAFEREKGACIVGRGLVERFRDAGGGPVFTLGSTIPLQGNIYPGTYEFVVRGIYEAGTPTMDENVMFFHWDYVDEVSGRRGEISTITILLEDPSRAPDVALAVDGMFRSSATRTRTLTERAFNLQFQGMWGNIPLFLSFIGGAVLFAAFMVTLNTLLLNARERITEVGVLKTLGFPDGAIGFLNLFEGVVLCLLGGALGIGLALLLYNGSSTGAFMDRFLPGFRVLPRTVAEALGIAVALGGISGMVPGLLASRIPVVRALRRIA